MSRIHVLVACERSGVIRDKLIAAGVMATSCDLAPTEKPGPHIQGDVRDVIEHDDRFTDMIAHPDCTFLTSSAEWAYTDGPYHQKVKPGTLVGEARRKARVEALEFVEFLWKSKIKRVAIENPHGCINSRLPFMPKPQYVQPYQFGDDASKRTGLWVRGYPKLVLDPSKYVQPRWVCCGMVLDVEKVGKYGCPNCEGERKPLPRWANQTNGGYNKLSPSADRWMDRSRTYDGIADALVEQWFLPLLRRSARSVCRKTG